MRGPIAFSILVTISFTTAEISHAQAGIDNLARVSHGTTLTFMTHDGHCVSGTISKVTALTITIKQYNKPPDTIQKSDLLQVGETEGLSHNLIYSARSSWTDVINATPGYNENLRIVLKDSRVIEGKPFKVLSDTILLGDEKKSISYKKSDISLVDYVRQNPISDNTEYFNQEAPYLLLFSPDTWIRAAKLTPRIRVRIYDVSKSEDNNVLKCVPSKKTVN